MSNEKEDFETRLSRRTAESLGMTWKCPRRQCRRGNRCMAAISPEGEPACLASLNGSVRQQFANCRGIASGMAHDLATNEPIKIRGNIDSVFILQLCLGIAYRTYAELAANRPLLRRQTRRIDTRWLPRTPRGMKSCPPRHEALAAPKPEPAEDAK